MRQTRFPAEAGQPRTKAQPRRAQADENLQVRREASAPANAETAQAEHAGKRTNQWSAETIRLERGSDARWRATVALESGHSYRYRYLLEGERWENARHAD